MDLKEKIETRQAVVSVVGLGYVGLPLAVAFAEAGFPVIGVDNDRTRVEAINRGESYIQDVPSGSLIRLVSNGASGGEGAAEESDVPQGKGLSATTSYDSLGAADAVIVCVPTPLTKTKDPDVSYILSATDEIAKRLHPDMLVALESTTYPGTTEELVLPRFQNAGGRRLTLGTDLFVAFSPERVDPGNSKWNVSNTPKVIGGVTARCGEMAKALYQCVTTEVVQVSTPKTAEMVKLLENTFRAANIGLVNEIAIICDRLGIDVWEVVEAARTKPFGFMAFYPGPGLGGHCIPVDPHFLAWKMKELGYTTRFVQVAEEINLGMPAYWVTRIQDSLIKSGKSVKGSTILVLGVTYKRDLADTRESPALDIIDQLLNKGAHVVYHDPYIPSLDTDTFSLSSIGDTQLPQALSSADCAVIVADHAHYDWHQIQQSASVIVDTRNALGGPAFSEARSSTGPATSAPAFTARD